MNRCAVIPSHWTHWPKVWNPYGPIAGSANTVMASIRNLFGHQMSVPIDSVVSLLVKESVNAAPSTESFILHMSFHIPSPSEVIAVTRAPAEVSEHGKRGDVFFECCRC